MRQARVAHRLGHFLGDAGPFAGDEGHGDLAGLAGQGRPDAGIDRRSQRIDLRPRGQIPRRRRRALERRNFARGVARCAQASEPGGSCKVETAGLDRLRRRLKRRPQRHRLADPHAGRVFLRHADADAVRGLLGLEVTDGEDTQHDPRPSLVAQFMRLDEPRDRHIAKLLREHRRAHHLGAELGDSEA
jgi:hypothetical protein